MVRLAIAVLLIFATTGRAVAQQAEPSVLISRAQDVVARLVSGEVEPLLPTLTDQDESGDRCGWAPPDDAGPGGPVRRLQVTDRSSVRVAGCDARGARVLRVRARECRVPGRVRPATIVSQASASVLRSRPLPYSAPAYVTASAFRDEAITVDAGGWPLPGTLTLPIGERTVSRRGARSWFGTERPRRIDRTEQAVSRSGGGAGQPRYRSAAIRQAHAGARRPGRRLSATSPSRRKWSTMRSRR